jgi:hypothetical protein
MYSDGILSVILKTQLEFVDQTGQTPLAISSINDLYSIMPKACDSTDIETCLVEVFKAMFGTDTIEYNKADKIIVKIDDKLAVIDLDTLAVLCKDDEKLEQMITTAITNVCAIFNADAKLNTDVDTKPTEKTL